MAYKKIYLATSSPILWPNFVGKYSSTMEHSMVIGGVPSVNEGKEEENSLGSSNTSHHPQTQ